MEDSPPWQDEEKDEAGNMSPESNFESSESDYDSEDLPFSPTKGAGRIGFDPTQFAMTSPSTQPTGKASALVGTSTATTVHVPR